MKSKPIIIFVTALCICSATFFSSQQTPKSQEPVRPVPFNFKVTDFGEVRVRNEAKVKIDISGDPEMPFDAPAHTSYDLETKRPLPALDKRPRYFYPAYSFICIVPTFDVSEKDFSAAYPNFSKAVDQITKLLQTKPKNFVQFDDLFDFPYNNAGWSFTAKVKYLEYSKVTGVFFLTQYSQEMTPNLINNEELTANFQGLTRDGQYYVAARFAITHPSLPRGIDFTNRRVQEDALNEKSADKINVKVGRYLQIEERKIEKLSDETFRPSIPTIKRVIASISPE